MEQLLTTTDPNQRTVNVYSTYAGTAADNRRIQNRVWCDVHGDCPFNHPTYPAIYIPLPIYYRRRHSRWCQTVEKQGDRLLEGVSFSMRITYKSLRYMLE